MRLLTLAWIAACGGLGAIACAGRDPIEPCTVTTAQPELTVEDATMVPICDGVFAEAGTSADEAHALRELLGTARAEVRHVFAIPVGDSPLVIFCHSAACKMAFGAPPEAAISLDIGFTRAGVPATSGFLTGPTAIVTAGVSGTVRILVHELIHAEMAKRIPYDTLPTWFNEGLAAMIADEPRCPEASLPSIGDIRELSTKADWQDHIRVSGATIPTYCQARHEVERWSQRFGNRAALGGAVALLVDAVNRGATFEMVYGER